jgi:ubiquinone biosynthesis accessory factor UbiJ
MTDLCQACDAGRRCPAYNRAMLHSLHGLFETALAPALAERLTLVLNHVLAAESVATERLSPHAGRMFKVQLQGWPSLLPPLPQLAWRISAAGLLEWAPSAEGSTPELVVTVDASNPALLVARALGGVSPAVQIEGDAQLAADVNWLLNNVRWDVAADLERVFGPLVAQQVHQMGRAVVRGMRAAGNATGNATGHAADGAANTWRTRGRAAG